HFFFYYRQAEQRLTRPGAGRVSRAIVDRFWAPVGSGEQGKEELRFLAGYLFGGDEGRAAARKIDETIRRLPGFSTVRLVEACVGAGISPSSHPRRPPPRWPSSSRVAAAGEIASTAEVTDGVKMTTVDGGRNGHHDG